MSNDYNCTWCHMHILILFDVMTSFLLSGIVFQKPGFCIKKVAITLSCPFHLECMLFLLQKWMFSRNLSNAPARMLAGQAKKRSHKIAFVGHSHSENRYFGLLFWSCELFNGNKAWLHLVNWDNPYGSRLETLQLWNGKAALANNWNGVLEPIVP